MPNRAQEERANVVAERNANLPGFAQFTNMLGHTIRRILVALRFATIEEDVRFDIFVCQSGDTIVKETMQTTRACNFVFGLGTVASEPSEQR